MFPRFLALGDSALTVEFDNRIDKAVLSAVAALDRGVNRERGAGGIAGIIETVPTYRSLTIIFDPGILSWSDLKNRVTLLLDEPPDELTGNVRFWELPVCYDADYGMDLERVSSITGLSSQDVIGRHTGQIYTVYMIGFLPGFPFMGDVVPELETPRLLEPRTRVPAGSVAVAGRQTAIYPWESPGGWNILGRCPFPLFSADRTQPALLSTGDRVRFAAVNSDRYEMLAAANLEKTLDFEQFLAGDEP